MALALRDFTVEQGSTFVLQFDLKNDDGTSLNTVVGENLGSYSFRMKCLRSKYGGLTGTLLDISNTSVLSTYYDADAGNTRDGFYVFSDFPGRVKFVISDVTTSTIKHGRHDYDIEVIDTKGSGVEVTKAFVGKMTFDAEATN
jgi:hypothetical protein